MDRILIFCPASNGGVADYAHYQAEALTEQNLDVLLLCPPDFPHRPVNYRRDESLPSTVLKGGSKLSRIRRLIGNILGSVKLLEKTVAREKPAAVLLATYSEYLAPLWAWRLRRLRRRGLIFGAVAHDPVRDFVVGPLWWHRRSISEGYSFLDHAFVHEEIDLDTGDPAQKVATTVIPHGPYPFPAASETREETRKRLDIPAGVPLFLSYGHLRNGKNLDLILKAMVFTPDAWLLVAGTEAGSGNTTSAQYRQLAAELGVADRCRWVIAFATPAETACYFTAADFVMLTYQRSFRSASGVLNVAVRYRVPAVVSCGESNLGSLVVKYDLGYRIEPDDAEAIGDAMRRMIAAPPPARWDDYERDNSWTRNAALVKAALLP